MNDRNFYFKVRCLDISSGGALGISCGDDGNLNIWNSSDGNLRVSKGKELRPNI